MDKFIKKAFTLIELLVVIAIIGILSGLIVVSMSGVTQKANIAKAQIFSNSLRNSLMLSIIAEWKFDELTTAVDGTVIQDSWGGTNNGRLDINSVVTTDAANKVKTGNECVSGSCLIFDGVDDYINCGTNSILKLGNAGTISAWIYPTVDFSVIRSIYTSNMSNDVDKAPYFRIETDGTLRAIISNGSTVQYLGSTFHPSLDKWQLATLTWDGTTAKIYLNADSYSIPQTEINAFTGTTFNIGIYSSQPVRVFNGKIDDVRIYNVAASGSQIKEQYYAGLSNLFINGGITKEEYLSRRSEIINSVAEAK